MDDLRWALLGLGGLFIAGLAWWELRKPRHAGRDSNLEGSGTTESRPARRLEPRMSEGDGPATTEDAVSPSRGAIAPHEDPPVMLIDDVPDAAGAMDIAIASDVAVDSPG